MKKSLIALAALATVATAAQAQSSVTVYGIMDVGVRTINNYPTTTPAANFTNAGNDNLTSMSAGNLSTSRFGFRGSEDLGGGLKANFTLESGISPATGANSQSNVLFDRKATVGLSGTYGSIDLGRNYNAGFDLAAGGITDANGLAFDSVTNYTIKGNFGSTGNVKLNPIISIVSNTNLGTTRNDNMIRYSNKFGNVLAIATYAVGGQAGDTSLKSSSSGALAYQSGQFNLGIAGYSSEDGAGKKLEYTSLGGNATFGAFKLTASFSEMRADKGYANAAGILTVATYASAPFDSSVSAGGKSKMEVSHVGLTYQATPALRTILAYYDTTYKGDGVTKGTNDTYTLTAIYSLSKRTDLYASLDNSKSKDGAKAAGGADKATGGIAGIRHAF